MSHEDHLLQIIAQRQYGDQDKPTWEYTTPPVLVPSIGTLFKSIDAVLSPIEHEQRFNLYYTLAHHNGGGKGQYPVRSNASFEFQTVLPFDIDSADTSKPLEYARVLAEVIGMDPSFLIVINSGNGIHLHINLRHPIRSASYFKELRPAYKELCRKIGAALDKAGLSHKVDISIFDAARVFRLPGTENRKPGREVKRCSIVQYSDVQVDIDLDIISGMAELRENNISSEEVARKFPTPDFPKIAAECDFIRWGIEHPEEVHEPDAFTLFSLLSAQADTSTIEIAGVQTNAEGVAKHIFDNAKESKSLARSDFQEKWEQAKRYGAPKCGTVNEAWTRGCKGCVHFGKLPTPLAIKSEEHIGSAENGYWVYDGKGNPKYPNYVDLAKVFSKDRPHLTAPDGRVLRFNGKFYEEYPEQYLRAWVDQMVVPVDPLREAHRGEFAAKIRASGRQVGSSLEQFFDSTVRAKLNCQNGVLDIMTGKLLPHSADFGFQNALPFDYDPNGSSEYFLDWLSVIMQNRVELMESLLDVMAYCLWPTYDDHIFVILAGDGSNGKSTILGVIEALVGKHNMSTLSLKQMSSNRFAPAALQGKMVNLSGESSGSEISYEEANVLKTLSSGDALQVERKGEDSFSFANRAKLIFSTTKPPRFADQGYALKRRMLTIPFDYLIGESQKDSRVGDRLVREAPQILAMLVRRLRDNVEKNGRFIVYRGGGIAEQATKRLLASGNTVVQWAEERIESSGDLSPDQKVSAPACYDDYLQWGARMGMKHLSNRIVFGRVMKDHVRCPASEEIFARDEDKTRRFYTRCRFKESIE